jgi:hypothetical protein
MKKVISALLVLVLITSMVSCMAIGTGGKKVNNNPTLGQELIDLKKAKDEGAVSQQEYEELKKKLKDAYQ